MAFDFALGDHVEPYNGAHHIAQVVRRWEHLGQPVLRWHVRELGHIFHIRNPKHLGAGGHEGWTFGRVCALLFAPASSASACSCQPNSRQICL
jgi:hypothetical protein